MTAILTFCGALLLFGVGLRLSAFFSGSETGFYRVSFLRLTIDAQTGDLPAQRLLWFSENPSHFVATTLVGNNVANYLATMAIGLATATLFGRSAGGAEIAATLCLSPVVFVFGELIPKYLYYRAPLHLLRRELRWFMFFFRLFRPVAVPLVWLARAIERIAHSDKNTMQAVLGRARLVQVLSMGHEQGLLTDIQSRLVNGTMHIAGQPAADSMTPGGRVLGLTADASRTEILDHARRYGLTSIPIRKAGADRSWYGYVRTVDVALSRQPLAALIREMPRIDAKATKLEAVLNLRTAGADFGVMTTKAGGEGLLSARGLVEQIFSSPQTVRTGISAAAV